MHSYLHPADMCRNRNTITKILRILRQNQSNPRSIGSDDKMKVQDPESTAPDNIIIVQDSMFTAPHHKSGV